MHYAALRIIDAHVPVSPDEVVYDLGCGLGRVVCHYARKPIKSAVGIELDPDLYMGAETNVARVVGRAAGHLVILPGDVRDYDLSKATLIFMFNPFGPEIMHDVLARVSGRAGLRIVYAGPAQEHVFQEFPALSIIDRFTVPYDLGRMAAVVWRHG